MEPTRTLIHDLMSGLSAAVAAYLLHFGAVSAATARDPAAAGLSQSLRESPLIMDLRETSFVTGFVDARVGTRAERDPREDDLTLAEGRLQLEYEGETGPVFLQVTADVLYDAVADDDDLDLETGRGWLDLRTASVSFTPLDSVDVKLGRQILTWGTGDLLFVNDLFPKDWNAFFIGRDEEYLKAPSDALKVSVFSEWANLDVVYMPRFDANRFPDNQRLSQWNPFANRLVGDDVTMRLDQPDDWFEDDEVALRVFRTLRGVECAFYAYNGFWKDPRGVDSGQGRATFPGLRAVGGSVRGTVGSGIGHAEVGYYHSRDDGDGDDRFVPNSQWRALVGYEQEVARDFTAGLQYYLELMEDHGAYERALPADFPEADQARHVATLRLTRHLLQQTLTASVFAYWSPSDQDAYLRPQVHYKVTDALSVDVGANVFLGEQPHTFFGQFGDNTNLYVGARYSF